MSLRFKDGFALARITFVVHRGDLVVAAYRLLQRNAPVTRKTVSDEVRDVFNLFGITDVEGDLEEAREAEDELVFTAESEIDRLWPELTERN